jgi:hypothetical protein
MKSKGIEGKNLAALPRNNNKSFTDFNVPGKSKNGQLTSEKKDDNTYRREAESISPKHGIRQAIRASGPGSKSLSPAAAGKNIPGIS